jgi:DNA repair exonuclease SbcCD nuclease subunit
MRVFCFGDIHIGPSRYQFVRDQEEKLAEWVLSAVRDFGCGRAVFLGDCFKERWHEGRDKDKVWCLFRDIAKVVDVVIIAGNHDYYDRKCDESGLIVLKGLSGVCVVDDRACAYESLDGRDVVYVPWRWTIREEERKRLAGDVVFGHFELVDAVNWISEEQITMEEFRYVNKVVSGHLHFRKEIGKVIYSGVPFQRGFADASETGGVVIDLRTLEHILVDGYGIKFVQVEKSEDLDKLDVQKCYVQVRKRELAQEAQRRGAVGVEYVPEGIITYDEEKLRSWEDEVVRMDLWQLLEEYAKKVLKVGDRELEWLRGRCEKV